MLAALAAFAGQAAVVYKWTDADGVVHYSDQPAPGAEKIATSGGTTNVISGPRGSSDAQQPSAQKPSAGLGYTAIAISSPGAEQVFFGDEPIAVALTLEPSLQPNHVVSWNLNGQQLGDQGPTSTQFGLAHLDRGTYSLTATVTDQQSGQSQSTASVTFYVRQPSVLSPEHRTP